MSTEIVEPGTGTAKTPCDCVAAGFCHRHGFTKSEREFELCKTREDYFNAYSLPDAPQKAREEEMKKNPPLLPDALPCVHRGDKSGELECKPCGGLRILDVFTCAKHQSCTVSAHNLPSAKNPPHVCISCDDRREAALRRIVIQSKACSGHEAVLAAVLRELHAQYRNQFEVDVRSQYSEQWENCPHVTAVADADAEIVSMDCDASSSNQFPGHSMLFLAQWLSDALKLPRPLRPTHWLEPSIWLTAEEKGWLSQIQEITGKPPRYWIVDPQAATNTATSGWHGFQRVVDLTANAITWVQIGEPESGHEPLKGVIDLTGKISLRQFIRLLYHCDGVLTTLTPTAHLAHWVERKPQVFRQSVVISGGREPPHWFAYPGQRVFSTIGELDCCESGGCWRDHLADNPTNLDKLCVHRVDGAPLCMRKISPESVVRLVRRLAT